MSSTSGLFFAAASAAGAGRLLLVPFLRLGAVLVRGVAVRGMAAPGM